MNFMDSIIDFVSKMTIWNWISAISFFVLPFTVANLFFNLGPRFRNWRATRSRKKFTERLKTIENELRIVSKARQSAVDFIAIIFHKLEGIVVMYMIIWFAFVVSCTFTNLSLKYTGSSYFYDSVTQVFYMMILASLLPLYKFFGFSIFVSNVRCPDEFIDEITGFIKEGNDKSFLYENFEAIDLINLIHESTLLNDKAKQELRKILPGKIISKK